MAILGPLAQLVEQQTLNLRVKGSIPLRLSLRKRYLASVVELADTLDLGSRAVRRGGSNPPART